MPRKFRPEFSLTCKAMGLQGSFSRPDHLRILLKCWFWFSQSEVEPKRLHFLQIPRWPFCCWSLHLISGKAWDMLAPLMIRTMDFFFYYSCPYKIEPLTLGIGVRDSVCCTDSTQWSKPLELFHEGIGFQEVGQKEMPQWQTLPNGSLCSASFQFRKEPHMPPTLTTQIPHITLPCVQLYHNIFFKQYPSCKSLKSSKNHAFSALCWESL